MKLKTLKTQVKILRSLVYLYIFVVVGMLVWIIHLSLVKDAPTFELKREITSCFGLEKEGYSTNGDYDSWNHIRLSLSSADALETIYHEYGHYIYSKKMTKEERKEWDLEYCTKIEDIEMYRSSNQCTEKWAREFANFTYKYAWLGNETSFTSKIFNKYIS